MLESIVVLILNAQVLIELSKIRLADDPFATEIWHFMLAYDMFAAQTPQHGHNHTNWNIGVPKHMDVIVVLSVAQGPRPRGPASLSFMPI